MASRNTTQSHLADVRCASQWGNHVISWTSKRADAPLTATERTVLAQVGACLDLGYISKPLLYSPAVRVFSKNERKALYSLLARGALRVVRYDNPEHDTIEPSS